ncbi:hypothetical protein JCM8097_007003 [Rhodosporidiobolus ruineniae]
MSSPSSKRPRMDSSGSEDRRVTRSSTRNAPAPAPASTSKPTDLDLTGSDDDEPFEYDSDVHSDDYGTANDASMDVDQLDQLEDADDEDDSEVGATSGQGKDNVETLTLSDTDDDMATTNAPPEPAPAPAKGKLTSRKQFAQDVQDAGVRFGGSKDGVVQNFRRDEGDEMIRFSLKHKDYPRGLKLCLMFPELAGYPASHEVMCFSENEDIGPEVEEVMGEVATLPKQANRSLEGIIEHLVHRLVQGLPSPYTKQGQETDEDEGLVSDDDLYGLHASVGQDSATLKALRSDFKDLLAEGYRPGYTRLSELDLVVSVSKKVGSLGVPARALQAWDSQLITGQVVYLVVLMNFGSKYPVDLDNQTSGQVKFKVGISPKYKPSKAAIGAAFRSHSSNTYTKGEFEAISLSAPLDALLNNKFQEILGTRRCNDRCGWAAAEQHCFGVEKHGMEVDRKLAKAADKEEKATAEAQAQTLPADPMSSSSMSKANNFPLLAFTYALRRFIMCPRFCLNCYRRCDQNITALKPFVCETPLCLFQLIALGLGPSLEHELITNTPAVDLLVQLCYTAAREGGLKDDMFPTGLELKVPKDKLDGTWQIGDETVDFDSLTSDDSKRQGIGALILELPPISEMKVWLTGEDMTDDERMLNRTRKLSEMRGGSISTSAWRLLQWIVASNTSHLKLIEEEDELLQGIPKDHRQFRLIVGSPAKEHLLSESIKAAQARNANAVKYPTLHAWHGSATKNFHSILRQGLHFKETINGRAYGHGVYFAKGGEVSLGHYAAGTQAWWKNAEFTVGKLAAICEITNLPKEYVSNNPYLVVNQLDWIQCRYLIVQRGANYNYNETAATTDSTSISAPPPNVKLLNLDPAHPLTLNSQKIQIPDVAQKLKQIEESLVDLDEELNDSDTELLKEPSVVFESHSQQASQTSSGGGNGASSSAGGNGSGRFSKLKRAYSGVAGGNGTSKDKGKGKAVATGETAAEREKRKRDADTFVPCDETRLQLVRLLPPPQAPNKGALAHLQRETREMMKVQEQKGPIEAGFYFDPERSDGNMFNWVVELPRESFDPDIPLVKDMVAKDVKSILMEIRFGDSYPFSPPFFRVVHPRFLPFIHGGGGHVTGGGSICMDLLTNDGWSSIYSIEAILLQIRVAMSNLEPRPGRLDTHSWNSTYSMEEAIAGFHRAASTHGWTVPPELEKIARGY